MAPSIVEIKGHLYRYAYDEVSGNTQYLGPVGDAPALSEEEFNKDLKEVEPEPPIITALKKIQNKEQKVNGSGDDVWANDKPKARVIIDEIKCGLDDKLPGEFDVEVSLQMMSWNKEDAKIIGMFDVVYETEGEAGRGWFSIQTKGEGIKTLTYHIEDVWV